MHSWQNIISTTALFTRRK